MVKIWIVKQGFVRYRQFLAKSGGGLQQMATILLLNGPNLNLLGQRETRHYGGASLTDIEQSLAESARMAKYDFKAFQSNAEHELIDQIHLAKAAKVNFILFNPAAFTHTSIALRDAILAAEIPFIEIHLSNIFAREAFRETSFFSDIAEGVITGFGAQSYELALQAAFSHLSHSK